MTDLAWWLDVKRWLVELTSLDRDALHIYFAVAIQLLTAAVTRYRLSDWQTLVPLVVLELVNEFADLRYEIWPAHDRALQYWAGAHDLFNTLAMPVLILLIARQIRRAAAGQGGSAALGDLQPDDGQQREQ